MDKEVLKEHIEEDDFVIRIRPFANDAGKWSGEVDISIMSFADNELDDEDYGNVMHFCKMMCAAVPIMEEAKEFRDIIHEYVLNVVDNDMEIDVELEEESGVEKTYEDNIVHLNFNSKTGGSA